MPKLLLLLSYWKVDASSRWQKKLFGSISNFCIPFTSVSTFNLNKLEKANCNPATRSQLCKWTLFSHRSLLIFSEMFWKWTLLAPTETLDTILLWDPRTWTHPCCVMKMMTASTPPPLQTRTTGRCCCWSSVCQWCSGMCWYRLIINW